MDLGLFGHFQRFIGLSPPSKMTCPVILYCTEDPGDIQDILSEITALISAAVLRNVEEPAEPEEAA